MDLTTKKIGCVLNEIFVIENKNYRIGSVLESIFFYKNINPNTEPGTKKDLELIKSKDTLL
ncbi:TPA: hypothetical protein ACG3SI_004093 [Clostridioides difficile]